MPASGLRSVSVLTHLTSGITRLRDKGGASPQALFDLLNGYIDISGAPLSRDGTTVDHTLPAGTMGLCAFKGKLNVFALTNIDPGNSNYVVNVLIHPNPNFAGTITGIPFAAPFLGYLYVVAEFSDGSIYHYWLQGGTTWTPNTMVQENALIAPTIKNGFLYKATGANSPPAWAPNVQTTIGTIVQPTVYNGFQYVCIEVDGSNPTTGSTEPAWPTVAGATVDDDNDTSATNVNAPITGTSGSPAGARYNNYPGASQ